MAGCSGSSRASAENDRLRRANQDLTSQVASLSRERDELRIKLAESARAREAALTPEVLEAIPRCTAIAIDSLSGWTPPSGPATGVVAYISPADGRGRFVQIVGTLRVDATLVPAMGSSEPPVRLASRTLTPGDLRDAYRSGFMGTGYTVELPLSAPVGRTPGTPAGTLLLRATFADALSGQSLSAERALPVR